MKTFIVMLFALILGVGCAGTKQRASLEKGIQNFGDVAAEVERTANAAVAGGAISVAKATEIIANVNKGRELVSSAASEIQKADALLEAAKAK